MVQASELDEWQVQPRGASPWLLVIFILLTIGGLVGCYFLYTKWAEAQKITDLLKGSARESVEEPLSAAQVKYKVDPMSQARYGKEFWSLAKSYVIKGTKYDAFAKLVGWGSREELLKLVTSATDLRAMFENLNTQNSNLQSQVNLLQKQFQKASTDLQAARDTMERQRKELQSKINQRLAELAKLQQEHRAAIKRQRDATDRLEKERQGIQSKVDGLKVQADKERQKGEATAEKLRTEIEERKKKIAKLEEFEKEKPGPDGKILQVNLGLKFGVINIGEEDTVERGERFEVYEMTGGGNVKQVKGEVVVKVVKSKTSQVAVTKQLNPLNPIISGDLLKRIKLRRKHGIKERAKLKNKEG